MMEKLNKISDELLYNVSGGVGGDESNEGNSEEEDIEPADPGARYRF